MRYRLTCLAPVLVGDGGRLSAIDYMVWKDHVNVLDQNRIFKLLAKGPRLDGYLSQLKKATKLDFASWGGFAQNFADRRIPFEHPAYSGYWNRAMGESLNIPTFASNASGSPYLPGSAIKGALRTGMLFSHLKEGMLHELAARASGDRPSRRPAEPAEERLLGTGGTSRTRFFAAADSAPVDRSLFKVYLLRVSALVARGREEFALGWKQSPRGTADGRKPEDSTPIFAEMASPGAVFEGRWEEKEFFDQADIRRALGWREPVTRAQVFEAANEYAAGLLSVHKNYADRARLEPLSRTLVELETHLADARNSGACLLSLGWGAGLAGKSAWLDTANPDYRQVLKSVAVYNSALSSGLPFPKTRHIVFLNDRPASLPGWVRLDVIAG
ncbi:MAG TPA: type III-A CRISPR-associated RAMP protein Csm5 [Bryobacteraceae bacterium]|nr:type III-A CRISPR-associated RAMP protein Csm5 [Bryobacteraceae bacterium]